MDAKTYLRQLTRMDKRIDALCERRTRYEALAMRRTGGYTGGMPGAQHRDSSVERYACKLVDLAREIDRRIDEYVDLTRVIEAQIAALPDGRHRDILTWRYVNDWSWDRISEAMSYDMRWVFRLHGCALSEFEKIRHKKPLPSVL